MRLVASAAANSSVAGRFGVYFAFLSSGLWIIPRKSSRGIHGNNGNGKNKSQHPGRHLPRPRHGEEAAESTVSTIDKSNKMPVNRAVSSVSSTYKSASNQTPVRPPDSQPGARPDPSIFRLKFIYERNPKPRNCTTFMSTRSFAEDPNHPYHIQVQRRLQSFDPKKFYWRVQVPMDVSTKSSIRNWAKKRIRTAFEIELKRNGINRDGTSKEADNEASSRRQKLSGALVIHAPKDKHGALTFRNEEVEQEVKGVLKKVMQRQSQSFLEH